MSRGRLIAGPLVILAGLMAPLVVHGDEKQAYDTLRETAIHIAIGSGSIVEAPSGDHYLLTNWHVCNSGQWQKKMRGNYEHGALVEGIISKGDPLVDLCAIKVPKAKKALKISKLLRPGQMIYTRGYPLGVLNVSSGRFVGLQSWEFIYSIESVGTCFKGSQKVYDGRGVLGGCRVKYVDNMTSLYSRPGSSGSPVVNEEGELVGVISSWFGEQDLGGMVRLEDVQAFFKGL